MITEDYVSFETAKLLKEKGFDEYCYMFYKSITYLGTEANSVRIIKLSVPKDEPFNNRIQGVDFQGNDTEEYAMPTLQMAMKWLRDEHSIHFFVKYFGSLGWAFTIQKLDSESEHTIGEFYTSYEKACEAAIKYCIENLI